MLQKVVMHLLPWNTPVMRSYGSRRRVRQSSVLERSARAGSQNETGGVGYALES
jgi:hypothetical protein